MTTDSLTGKVVAITGADGFIGSHVTEKCVEAGASVRAMCMYNSQGTKGWLEDLADEVADSVDVQFGDVRDPETLDPLVAGADIVLHLAALIAIPYSYQAYRSFIEVNVTGTLNVLEAVRRHDVQRMIQTSTSEVYGSPDTVPITEDHPLKAQSPYSASKIAADKLCEAWACSFGTPVSTLRPFNTFGPRQSLRAVIPSILAQMLGGAEELKIGNLTPKRDLTYVSDTAEAFVASATADLSPGEVIQLGTGRAVSIEELVDLCSEITQVRLPVDPVPERMRPPDSEVSILLSDPSRALVRLNWKPTVGLEEGLRRTTEALRIHTGSLDYHRYHR